MSRKHGMSRGSSWPATAFSAMCWWSTGIDGVNTPTIADTRGAQMPAAFTTTSHGISPASVTTARTARSGASSMPVTRVCVRISTPELARRGGQRVRRGVRIEVAVAGHPDGAVQVARRGGRHPRHRVGRPEQVGVEADPAGAGHAPLQLLQALRAGRDPQRADRLEHPQLAVQLDRVAAQPHHRGRRVELRDEAGRLARRPARQLALLEQHHVAAAGAREVVRDARARDAPSDDDDPRALDHGARLYRPAAAETVRWRRIRRPSVSTRRSGSCRVIARTALPGAPPPPGRRAGGGSQAGARRPGRRSACPRSRRALGWRRGTGAARSLSRGAGTRTAPARSARARPTARAASRARPGR